MGASSRPGVDDELAELELAGPDPVETLGDVERFMAGWTALGAPDYAKAEAIFRDLSARYPDSLPILNSRTRALLSLGRLAEATPLLRRGLELFPNDAKLLFRLAIVDFVGVEGADPARGEGLLEDRNPHRGSRGGQRHPFEFDHCPTVEAHTQRGRAAAAGFAIRQ